VTLRAQLDAAEAAAKEALENKAERIYHINFLEKKVDHQVSLLRALLYGSECLTGTTRSRPAHYQ